jgi:penicillin-binding protein 2A
MVGYTPNLVGAIWIGYDQTDREHYLPSSSSTVVVPIFREIMKESLKVIPHQQFEVDSINARLAGTARTKNDIQEQAREISKELNKSAQKISGTIKEQAPVWKKGLDQAINNIGNAVDSIVGKLQSIRK